MRELLLSVDYGQTWPLSDIMWFEEDGEPLPDWDALITPELKRRLREWALFFNQFGNYETGLFGSEERRRWFDLEGVVLFNELRKQVGHLYDVRIDLWF
jgi:hypothetical protein